MDRKVSDFARSVYDILREVPFGKVTTYGDLAARLKKNCSRAVGSALKNNPFAPKVPCHRVVRSDGRIGGFKGATNGREVEEKVSILRSEGVEVMDGSVVDFDKKRYRFKSV